MKFGSALSTLLGLALLAAVAYGLFYLARFGLGVLEGLPEATALAAAAAVTLLLAATIVANGLHAIARREDVRQQRAVRAAVYEEVLRLRSTRVGPALPGDDERTAEQRLLLHASPAVLSAYLRLRRAAAGGAQEELAQLVRAMRRDLGRRGPDAGIGELTELLSPSGRARFRIDTGGMIHG